MAKYWDGLEKHLDSVGKHKITAEEIQFLKDLQKEMNTQNTVGQADPRYWVIRNYEKVYGESLCNADGIAIYDDYNGILVLETDYPCFGTDSVIEKILNEFKEQEYELDEDTIENLKLSYDMRSLVDALNDIEEYNFRVCEYEEIPKDEGMFLTHEAAVQHLKQNEHHYSENAHTYAKTAWRSSEELLWKILQTVDFGKLN